MATPKTHASSPGGTYMFYGTLALRPIAGVLNRYYYATDVFMLFRDTGAAWELVPGYFERWLTNVSAYPHIDGVQALDAVGRVSIPATGISVRHTVTIDRIVYATGTTVAGNVRVGLYRLGALGHPDLPDAGALAIESASDAQPAINVFHSITVADTRLTPGLYFPAIQGDNATSQFRGVLTVWRHTVDGNVNATRRFDNSVGYGAFDTPCPVTVGLNLWMPIFWLRIKSIP